MLIARHYQTILKLKGEPSNIIDLNQLPHDFIFSALYKNCGRDMEFNKFVDVINGSDKFIFVVPEYNGSFPGVLKGFIDGLEFGKTFKNKKGALVGISSGAMAGALALSHLTDILNYLGMNVLAVKPRLPRIEKLYMDGIIHDEFLSKLVESQIDDLINF
jgi:NAD(P)H-dependent FMN reductase